MLRATSTRSARTYVLLVILSIGIGTVIYHLLVTLDSLPEDTARHVVLVVFDTLRADRMSVYGYSAKTTPYLEEASQELLRYGSVEATAPWTIPSHASMLTGLWPSEHGAQWGSIRLKESHLTLAEILSGQGFCTLGFSANPFVSNESGLAQGFDAFELLEHTPSADILREVARVLERVGKCRRLFLFINLMDTHIPYAFERYADAFGVSQPPIRTSEEKWAVNSGEHALTRGEVEQHRRTYDAAVRSTDDLAKGVVEMLRDRRLLDDTLLIFTSDHGEGLAEHPEMGHVLSVWEEQLAVPLLVRLPRARRGGEVYERRISLVGLTPSILDWLGVPRPPELADRPTLEETADGPIIADYRSYFAEDERGFNREMGTRYPSLAARVSHHHVIYCGSNKLIVSPGERKQFFDVEVDSAEHHDLASRNSTELRSCLVRYHKQLKAGLFSPFDRAASEKPVSERALERFKSLGYLQ